MKDFHCQFWLPEGMSVWIYDDICYDLWLLFRFTFPDGSVDTLSGPLSWNILQALRAEMVGWHGESLKAGAQETSHFHHFLALKNLLDIQNTCVRCGRPPDILSILKISWVLKTCYFDPDRWGIGAGHRCGVFGEGRSLPLIFLADASEVPHRLTFWRCKTSAYVYDIILLYYIILNY